ncbi:MAG TPA: GTP 3',8-cyclase MoaA [Anaerolineales bacterium]|nr:GTP 3',8-cyclase MoaA [Anaerolineales bacterium]
MALDRYGRRLHYLRISLTDHCNLRCIYCMPEEISFRPNSELLQDDEILTLVDLFASLGVDKIRLTGGEPTVRANIVELVRAIRQTPGIRTISMTSNGILFSRLALPLAQAGLQRVNFSLDTLDPARFRRLTRWGSLEQVWAGIEAAERAGLTPIKINVVAVRDYNEPDILPLAKLTLDHPWQVRFIEMMPFGGATEFQRMQGLSEQAMRTRIEEQFGPLQPLHGGALDGEARLYQIPGGQGELGFISTVSQPFCASCTRLRLTADGRLRLCLLNEQEIDLLTPLRQGATRAELRQMILNAVWEKPWGHRLDDNYIPLNRTMSEIGG